MKEKKKKLNNMSIEELFQKKEELEKSYNHEKKTKSKINPKIVKWNSNQIQSRYYLNLIKEIEDRERV